MNNGMNLGCTAICTVQPLWVCVANVCHLTDCGDGIPEPPAEECDDHNNIPYDGCSPTCQKEPHCAGGSCTAVCGDGLVFGTEQCDDGNLIDGDGCDHNCMIESGWQCTNSPQAPASTLTIPILYRDMHYYNTFTTSNPGMGHPDFENYNGGVETGLVKSTLGSDGEPVFNHVGSPQQLTNAADFCWWYHEVATADSPDCGAAGTTNPFDSLVYQDAMGNPTTLTLTGSSNVYTYTNDNFFPLDGLGWNASATTRQVSNGHNFSFTSELHYPFTYDKTTSPTFTFNGDDDVWVFINGQLAVDIGGVHGKTAKSVQLTPAEATTLGLADGGMYSIDVFQAERHTTASTYGLTLSGFSHIVSTCSPICGDGVIEGNEGCDDGTALNNNMYGGCASDCSTREGYCGDDLVNGPEQCDDGVNQGQYSLTTKTCAAGCVFAPYCGDGSVDTTYGEQCDLGTAGNTGAYGGCTAQCKLAGSCGDGIKNGSEQCDDGINNGAPADRCDASCNLKCGNGVVDPGEQCDDGSTNNTGGYGKCNMNCTFGPRCGDGVKSGSEQCDDGTNNGSYGTCDMDCTLAPYCGDGVKSGPEQCDNGSANSVTAYGPGQCTAACAIAPYCGDGIVETAYGEQCDGGSGCTADCQFTIQ
jgi:fibro-slime domain-containing protein